MSVNVTVPERSSPVSRNHSRRRASVGVLDTRRESVRWKFVRRVVRGLASVRGVMVLSFLCGVEVSAAGLLGACGRHAV